MNYLVIVLITGLMVVKVSADYMEDSWEEPNSWVRESLHDSGSNVCPVCDVAEDGGLAAFCFKKLIANLFNKNTLKKNEYTGQLERTILFTVSPAQLQVIEKSTDIRDLDTAITEILKAAKVVTGGGAGAGAAKESGSLIWLFIDIIKDSFQIFTLLWSNSELRFISFIIGVMMLIWFIHKRYNKNLIAVVATGFFLFGYLFTYLECNRKLEAEEFIAYVKENEDPPSGWFMVMFNSVFRKSKEDKQISKIQEQTKIKFPFCRPDSVLAMYINEMFLNQLEFVIHKCVSMSVTFKDSMSFPYNIIAMVSVPFLFVFITKLVFKYFFSPTVWFNIWNGNTSKPDQPQQQLLQNNPAVHEDRITGPNLQLLLQALAKHTSQQAPLPSGVEEVLECLENGSADRKSDESRSEDNVETSINLDKISQEKAKKES